MSEEFNKDNEEAVLIDPELLDEQSDLGDDVSLDDVDGEEVGRPSFYEADDETSEGYSF